MAAGCGCAWDARKEKDQQDNPWARSGRNSYQTGGGMKFSRVHFSQGDSDADHDEWLGRARECFSHGRDSTFEECGSGSQIAASAGLCGCSCTSSLSATIYYSVANPVVAAFIAIPIALVVVLVCGTAMAWRRAWCAAGESMASRAHGRCRRGCVDGVDLGSSPSRHPA